MHRDIGNGDADDHTIGGDEHDLVVGQHGEGSDDLTAVGLHLHGGNTLTAAVLGVERIKRRALAGTLAGHQQQFVIGSSDRAGHDGVALFELDAANSGSDPAHLSDLVRMEAHEASVLGHQVHVELAVDGHDAHQLVFVSHFDGTQAVLADVAIGAKRRLLHHTVAGHKQQVAHRLVIASIDHRHDRLVLVQLEQVHNRRAARGSTLHRNLVRAQLEHAPEVGEEQHVGMGGGVHHNLDQVALFELGSLDANATTALGAELIGGRRLDIATVGQREDELFVVDEVFDVELARIDRELGAALVGVLVADLGEFLGHDLAHADLIAQNFFQVGNGGGQIVEFGLQVGVPQSSEPAERHIENVGGLNFRELERCHLKPVAGRGTVFRVANQGDDFIDQVDRSQQAFDDVSASLGLIESELRSTSDDVGLVVDIGVEHLQQVQRARHAVVERHHVHAERRLQWRELEEIVQHHLGNRISSQLEHQAGLAFG